jgi:uncharacterized protein YcfJ
MNSKLFVAVIAVLNVGIVSGCADRPDTADAVGPEITPIARAQASLAGASPQPSAISPAAEATVPSAELAATTPAASASAPVDTAATVVAPRPAAAKPLRAAPSAPVRRPVPQYARVVHVADALDTVSEPRQVCRDEQVVKQAPVKDEHQVAGTLAGAVVGAVIGNQIGDGKGRKIARVVGAAGGAYAGNKIQERAQASNTVTEAERRCETVYETQERRIGYDVTYTYDGRTETVRMQQRPGSTLPVRNGEVVTT